MTFENSKNKYIERYKFFAHKIFSFLRPWGIIQSKQLEDGTELARPTLRYISNLIDILIIGWTVNALISPPQYLLISRCIKGLDDPIKSFEKFRMGIEVSQQEQSVIHAVNMLGISFQIVGVAISCAFIVYAWQKWGCTPGKAICNISVVDRKTLKKPTMWTSIKRMIATPISILPIGLGFVWSGWDSKSRTFHDIISGTLVIKNKNKQSILSHALAVTKKAWYKISK